MPPGLPPIDRPLERRGLADRPYVIANVSAYVTVIAYVIANVIANANVNANVNASKKKARLLRSGLS